MGRATILVDSFLAVLRLRRKAPGKKKNNWTEIKGNRQIKEEGKETTTVIKPLIKDRE